jgi:hypothetical protein
MCILNFLFDFLIDMVGYTVARLVLPLVSFRKIYVQPLNSAETRFNALGYRYDDDGRLEIESTIAGFIGFVVCVVVFFGIGLLIRAVA